MNNPPTLKQVNDALYAAAFHLSEAGKHLAEIEAYKPHAMELFQKSLALSEAIQLPPEKVSEDKINDILSEILGFDGEKKNA
jgi:hypothetical protein